MASRRKPFDPKGRDKSAATQFLYAAFVADLLDGTITATAVHEVVQGQRVRLEYDDPNGEGQARVARADR